MLSEYFLRLAVSRAADAIERNPDPYGRPITARKVANLTAKRLGLTDHLLRLAEDEMRRRSRKVDAAGGAR